MLVSHRTAYHDNLTTLGSPSASAVLERSPNPGGERETHPCTPVLALAAVGFGVSKAGGMTVRSASLNLAHTDMPIWGFRLLFNGFLRRKAVPLKKEEKKKYHKNFGSINVNH